jgi:hypothetical protein
MEGKVSNQRSTRGFKGDMLDSSPSAPAHRVNETFAHARAPWRNNHSQPRRLGSRGMQTCKAYMQ